MLIDMRNRLDRMADNITFNERSYIAVQYEKWCDEQPIKVQKNALSLITFLINNELLDPAIVKLWIENREREN